MKKERSSRASNLTGIIIVVAAVSFLALSGASVVHRGYPASADVLATIGQPDAELHLSHYADLASRNPIFGFAGANTTQLKEAVAELAQERDIFMLEAFFKGRWGLLSAAYSMYPVSFLETLPELEEARRQLISHPTYPSAYRYHELLLSSLRQYRKEAEQLRSKIISSMENKNIQSIGFFEQLTSSDDLEKVFTALDDASIQALATEDIRFTCLQEMRDCSPSESAAFVPPATQPPLSDRDTGEPLKDQGESELVQYYLQTHGLLKDVFYFSADTGCFNSDHSEPMIIAGLLHGSNDSAVPQLQLIPTDAVYFASTTQSSVYSGLTAEGYDVHVQSLGNFYMCPDLTYYPRMATMRAMREDLLAAPLFGPLMPVPGHSPLVDAASLEHAILQENIMDEKLFESYGTALASLESRYDDRALENLLGSTAAVARLHELSNEWREQSGGLQWVIAEGVHQAQISRDQALLPDNPSDPSFLYIIRSFFSLYFFLSNESIVPESPLKTKPISDGPAFTSLSDLQRRYSSEDIRRIIQLSPIRDNTDTSVDN